VLLEARRLTKVYRPQEEAEGEEGGAAEVRALDGVNLRIHAGEYVAIVGPSGSGKSTLMQILGLLDRPTSGVLRVGGRDVARLSDDQLATLRNRSVGFIFQFFNLLARTSAMANVALPLIYARHREPQARARAILQKVGMGDRLFHAPHQLSGGQQQRVAIARALANEPRIVFADEPTGNISTRQAAEVMVELDRLNREGVTVIVVTHEEDIAKHARRTVTMRDGRIVGDRTRRVTARRRAERLRVGRASALPSRDALVENLRMALTALGLNKVRTLLTTLGVLIGVGAVICTTAMGEGAKAAVKARLASLGSNLLVVRPGAADVRGTGGAPRFTMADVQILKGLTQGIGHVRYVDPTVQGGVVVSAGDKNWQTRLTGCQPAYADMRAAKPVAGRFFTEAEDRARARVCLIGNTVIKNLYAEGFDPTGTLIKINKTNFQIVGILPVKGGAGFQDEDDVVIVPLNTAMNRILGQTTISSIDIEATDSESVQDAIDEVTEVLRRTRHVAEGKGDDFNVRNMADIQAAMEDTSQKLSTLITVIALVSLLVGGIGIMNIMLVSVRERTKEIGLRKALGAHNLEVLFQFLVEALLIGIIGGLAGILGGSGVAVVVSAVQGWPILLPWGMVCIAVLVSAVTGIGFGMWPAWQASRLSPIEALRYE